MAESEPVKNLTDDLGEIVKLEETRVLKVKVEENNLENEQNDSTILENSKENLKNQQQNPENLSSVSVKNEVEEEPDRVNEASIDDIVKFEKAEDLKMKVDEEEKLEDQINTPILEKNPNENLTAQEKPENILLFTRIP
uniref:Uncharacterized protein n=1 Tax=Acrobeloides nanus TaxID=290746 RepID=A0A914D3R1_9BILA